MTWLEILATPLFWIVSTIGTVVISIIANLLTPQVSALITKTHKLRRLGTRKKQIERRSKVTDLQKNIHRRISRKVDGLCKFLMAISLLLLCVLLFQAPGLEVASAIVAILVLIVVVALLSLGLDDISLAWTADRREIASEDFAKKHETASVEEVKKFEDGWDRKEFGVTSQDATTEITPHQSHN